MSYPKRVERFRQYNINRKIKAIHFDEEKATFLFKVIPFLLHSNYPDLPGYVDDPHCAWGIHRFSPKKVLSRDLFLHYFPRSRALQRSISSPFSDNPCIHSLKTIGSIGTIAQTHKSDCDYWVSIRKCEISSKGRELLQEKCHAIESWAAKKGHEIYFFLMDIDETRENRFDSKAEEESAGSALKLLLKDELFRTHIQVAGKMLLWWIIPPGLSEKEYQNYVQRLKASQKIDLSHFVDLGYIADIPKAEIFGACLWQMNKAFDSPFKSIIKFAYLELLMRARDSSVRLFSDQIKLLVTYPDRVTTGTFQGFDLGDIDPYLLLAQEIVSFYKRQDVEHKQDNFIRTCLFLKTLEDVDAQEDEDENRRVNHLLGTSKIMEDLGLLPENVEHYLNFRNWRFQQLIELGSQVHSYLTNTYNTFRDLFKAFDKETTLAISEHDLSVLGRRLFTFHEKKEHKIEFIKGLSHEIMRQKEITFHASRHDGKDYLFAFQGRFDTVSIIDNAASIIKREAHLIRLVTWLIVNGILTPKSRLYLTKNYLPFNLHDIAELRDHLLATFPQVHLSHIPADQLLKKEVIVQAMAVINFSKAKVKGSKTLHSTIISTNSYGEYFLEDYSTLTQYKNALATLLTKHFVSRWNNNLSVYIPDQPEKHLISNMLSS